MKLSSIWLLSLLPLAAACAGGGAGSRAVPQSDSAPFGSQRPSDSVTEATILAKSTPVPVSSDLLYVANAGNNSITVYHHDVEGDTAPLKIIAGSKTGITSPEQLSEDARGNLYVTNANPASVLVFAHTASGNVAPIRKLEGSLAYLTSQTLATSAIVDPATGKLFVSVIGQSSGCGDGVSYIMRFPPNATGNEAPYAVSTNLCYPYGALALDSTGKNIIGNHWGGCCSDGLSGVDTFGKQFGNGDTPTVVFWIGTFFWGGLADDPTTKTYLVSGTDFALSGIFRFAEDTVGEGAAYGPATFKPPIVSVITSDTCGTGLALGYLRNIYVVHDKANGCSLDAIYVYEHDASGNAKPLRVLSGSATKLNQPSGIYEGA